MNKIMWIVFSSLTLLLFSITSIFIINNKRIYNEQNSIKNIYINSKDKIIIELNSNKETKCYIGNDFNDNNWIDSKDSKCILNYVEDNKYIFLKNKYGIVNKFDNKYNLSSIKEFGIKNNKIYLAIGGKEKIDYYLESIVEKEKNIVFTSSDESIASVDNNGLVLGRSVGETTIIISLENYNIIVNVVVTDKIINPSNEYNYDRDYITCNEYTKEENDLIDEILANRIAKVGKSTRAAVVEASRFMTLEFGKRIPYFGENGRLSYEGKAAIDGEGRYYKVGMYLSSSRYDKIGNSMHGPGTWGCKLYSYPNNRTIPNGLDCSGFVSWAFINAGFDVGDIGAGITGVKDFTDLGIKKYVGNSVNDNKIIVGDLLSGKYSNGGHIAIVVGINEGHYYVAESLFADTHKYYGVITRKYKSENLKNYFTWHIDMSEFYIDNGNLTDYWIN